MVRRAFSSDFGPLVLAIDARLAGGFSAVVVPGIEIHGIVAFKR